jgi:hypothetical protein
LQGTKEESGQRIVHPVFDDAQQIVDLATPEGLRELTTKIRSDQSLPDLVRFPSLEKMREEIERLRKERAEQREQRRRDRAERLEKGIDL